MFDAFVHEVESSKSFHPDGRQTVTHDPAVWTLAHRGYSGNGRLDVWAYPSQEAALRAGAGLAMDAGLDEDDQAVRHFAADEFQKVLDRYAETHRETHVLSVQAAFLQTGVPMQAQLATAQPGGWMGCAVP